MSKKPVTSDIRIRVEDPTGMFGEKEAWRSKKMFIFLATELLLILQEFYAIRMSADRWVQIALIAGIVLVACSASCSFAIVDAAVRFAKAWRQAPASNVVHEAMTGAIRDSMPPSYAPPAPSSETIPPEAMDLDPSLPTLPPNRIQSDAGAPRPPRSGTGLQK